ncbi:MAG: hypothetical protein ACRDT2_22255, partial [Natronosporangium sp.]
VPEGFFIGPYARGGRASMGTAARPTSRLLAEVAGSGQPAPVEPGLRQQAAQDLAYWRAECVVLDPDHVHHAPLLATLAALLGPGEQIAGAWVWRL